MNGSRITRERTFDRRLAMYDTNTLLQQQGEKHVRQAKYVRSVSYLNSSLLEWNWKSVTGGARER